MGRLKANLAAIKVVLALRAESRAATAAEHETLAGWSGWGAVKPVFEDKPGQDQAFTLGRQRLKELLTADEYAAARRNTINAHYTGTALARALWDGLAAFGFAGGRVLEPGCGSGNFIGLAPLGTAMVGIELDPVTAHVAAALYPHALVRNESFADTQLPEGSFDAAIGNVPFGQIHLLDHRYNPDRAYPIHTHFIIKSAALVRPGGWIALITSRYTLDGTGEDAVEARRQLARLGELAAAVRLPSSAHRRAAGTDVVTDVLVIRRFEDGEEPPPGEPAWVQTVPVDAGGVQVPMNRHFADNPGMVLGDLATGGARRADDLQVIAPAGTDAAAGLTQALAGAAAGRAVPAPRPAAPSPAGGRPLEGYQQARADGTFARMTDRSFEPFDPPGGPAGQAELRALLGLRDTAIALLDAELATAEDAGLVDGLRADLNARYDAYVAACGPVNRYTPQVKIRDTPEGRALREQLLAEGLARLAGGNVKISDPAVQDQLVADGHATVTDSGELKFGRTRAARAERQRLLDSGQARALGGTFTLTDAGRARVLGDAADLPGAVTIIRVRPAQGGFRNDPLAVRVMALEKYDPETGTARKTDIMRHRVLLPRPAVEHVEEPKEALAICMDRHAEVRLDVIAGLLGATSEHDARDRLGTLVYHDPSEGRLVPAQEYLSGDVRVKLRQAQEAAAGDPAYQANLTALTGVIPADLGPAEIEARLGAVFITAAEVQQFLREILADGSVTATLARNGTWSVNGGDRHSVAATLTWGTLKAPAQALAEHLLNRKGPVEITWTDSEGRTHVDEEATQAAREKQGELSDRFAGWAWEDLDRATEICRRYNAAFNSIVLRSYDEVQLSLPGVNRDISPYWWQKAAVARMIYEPTAGLFHDMGAGKTLEQIIGVMEQRRLGLIRKPVICVKNHLLDQFRDEFLWAYPQARILCADTEDLEGERRREFIARCATENPDAIIMTRGAFEAIPLTPEGHEAYLNYMKQMFTVHAESVADSVADQEILLAEFEQKLRKYFDPDAQEDDEDEREEEQGRARRKRKVEQDPAMCWEQMGIDYICVDESQDFNNLWVPSNEPGMGIGFVHRSIDLEMKLHATRHRYGSRAGALATGTPVTNKIAQFYVLQRYLRPERLEQAGFAGYAPWAATYTEPEQRLEMKADGSFGLVTRMRLINFPELLLDLHYFGDFKDADDIGLERPAIRGGKSEIRGIRAVTELTAYQSTLPERYREAKGGRRRKGDDTVVAVIGDGFRAAQDLRLVKAYHGERPRLTDEPQKIDYIADDVYAEWLAHRDDAYPGADGHPDPVTGSLQLVFCNEGVPGDDWNLYDELRNLLIERGMPRSAIRFIHEAGSDSRKKAALFAACNAGHVGVLIGSTEKMGVGTNVQRRCIGIHHVHPHWRPDYDAQEDARARRPGNLNAEVFIKKWITEGSFDTIRAQACERKSVFLHVIKHRDTSVRSIEAPGDDTVSYAEIAAVGAGEPRLIQKAQLESEVQQLARAQRRHLNNQNALKVAEQQAHASVAAAEQAIRDIDLAVGRIIPTVGDAFSMTVDGTTLTARREAGDQLITRLREARARVPAGECHTMAVGTVGGFQITADLAHDGRENTIVVRLAGLPGGVINLDHRKLPAGIGLVTRLENRLTGLDKLRLEQQAIIDRQRQEITRAQSAIGAPFPQQEALLAAKKALDDLVEELREDKGTQSGGGAGSPASADAPPVTQDKDSLSTSPKAGIRPARPGGHATTGTTAQEPGSIAAKPASAGTGARSAAGPDWTSRHPLASDIAAMRQAALAAGTLTELARTNEMARFLQVFRPWADDHVVGTAASPGISSPFATAYFDDPVFAADLIATLSVGVHRSLTGFPGPGDPGAELDAIPGAAHAVHAGIQRGLQAACSCNSGCDRCRLPGDRDADLAEAVRISVHLSRKGIPAQQRVITWDQQGASYAIEYRLPDGGTFRLTIPPGEEQIHICSPDGSDVVLHQHRSDPDAAYYAAMAYAEATAHAPATGTPHPAAATATPPEPDREGAAPATGPDGTVAAPAPSRPAARDQATNPNHAADLANGLVIEHHPQGTLVHGTQKDDHQTRRLLGQHGFRWSRNLNAWYLPRPWTFSVRSQRVNRLTAGLRQADRPFTTRTEPLGPTSADDSSPEPLPSADPYTDVRQARNDHFQAVSDYWALTRTPAGNNVMSTYPESGARPDALALNAAYNAVRVSWDEAFAGDPHEVADRFTAWAQAAGTLARNLADAQHRAPKFGQTLDTFISSATRLASRAQATARDPATWARVFADVPGNAPASDPDRTAFQNRARPAAGSTKPSASPTGNAQVSQDSDRLDNATGPAAAPGFSAGTTEDLPIAVWNAVDHPHVQEDAREAEMALGVGQADEDREAAAKKSRQARAALDSRGYEQALALLDEAELLAPDPASWEAARTQAHRAISQAEPPQSLDRDGAGTRTGAALPSGGPAPAADGAAGEKPRAAPGSEIVASASTASPAAASREPGPQPPEDPRPEYPVTRTGQEPAAVASPGTAVSTSPGAHGDGGRPEDTQPLAAHTGWAGNLRPERLLYADGTLLTVRGQGDDGDQVLPATAVGVIPATEDSDYGAGRLQVVRWDDGRHAIVHPALASLRGADPYAGLSDRERVRWQAFDLAEAWPTTTAGLLAHLIDPGDTLEVERGARSRVMELLKVASIRPGEGRRAGGLEFKVKGRRTTSLWYPDNYLAPVCIPQDHPTLAAAIRAATAAPGRPEAAAPAAGEAAVADNAAPGDPDAAGLPATAGSDAPTAPGAAGPASSGRYSSRIRVSFESGTPTVSGTSHHNDPAELREALRANEFNTPEAPPSPTRATAIGQPGPVGAVGRPASASASSRPEQSTLGTAASEIPSPPAPGESESPGESEPEPSPVNNSDLAIALRRLPDFTLVLSQAGTPPQGGTRGSRRAGEPNAGAYQALDSDSNGIEITISGPGFRRHGRLTWPQVASWIDAGVTPARLGIIITADRLSAFCRSRRDELATAGRCDPDTAASEFDQIRDDAILTVINAALRTRGAAAPVPAARSGKPAYYSAAMITRPDPAASREENATLERLTQLRAAIREQQPITAGEVKAEIRRWIGDGLPGYVRALGKPEAMRTWISRQVGGPARRPVRVAYDTPGIPGGRWHGASPEGLLTAVGNDDRAETVIPWEEIPAWVQPGITSSLRDRLTAADDAHTALFRRRLTAAVHPQASLTAPSDQDDEQATRARREAIADAWAAIEAAPPPAPAQLEAARRAYHNTGPVQAALFDDPRQASQQRLAAQTSQAPSSRIAESRPTVTAAVPETPGTGIAPPEPGREQNQPVHEPARTGTHQGQGPGSAAPQAPGNGTPLTTDDILIGLGRLPAFVIGDLISAMDGSEPLDSVVRQLAPWSGNRQAGEPDAGARERVAAQPAGLHITITASSGSRAGLLPWAEVAGRLRPGMTPGRRQVVTQASRAALRFAAAHASFHAAAEGSLAAAAEEELRDLARAAVTAMLSDAHQAAGAAPPRPARHEDEAGALQRISELAAALPGQRPQPRTPVSQVRAGDIIGHPGYKLQPFLVSAAPRHLGSEVEVSGRLTAPSAGEPAGQVTFTLTTTRNPDPFVALIPLPQRSLRSLFPDLNEESTSQNQAPGPQASDRESAPEPSRRETHAPEPAGQPGATAPGARDKDTAPAALAPGAPANPRAPQDGMSHITKEDAMPPSPADTPREVAATLPVPDEPGSLASPPDAREPAGQERAEGGRHQASPTGQPGDGTDLIGELDRVLDAIVERRRGADRHDGGTRDDFTDIRAAFTLLRNALDIGGLVNGYSPRPAAIAPGQDRTARPAQEPAHGPNPTPSEFDDIRSAFAELRSVLDLPASGRHARGTALPPDPSASRLLDQAAEEAQACARWYRDTPEWQRITTIGRAARELIGAIKEAARDYWAEIRQDIRVRGFARTLAARVCLGVSGAAHVLAGRLERSGRGSTRMWRAAWGLHRATATFADRIMRYTPPRNPDRIADVRRVIDDLAVRQRSGHAPAHAADGARPESAHEANPVRLARVSFTGRSHPVQAAPLAEPARRTEAPVAHRHRAGPRM